MAEGINSESLPHDKSGYRIYGVMAHLSDEQARAVKSFHLKIGVTDFATRPYCSIHNFYGPKDLNLVQGALAETALRHRPFNTRIDLSDLRWFPDGAAYTIEAHPSLVELHEDVVSSLVGLVELLYPRDQAYWPHTTILLSATEEELREASEQVMNLKFAPLFQINSIELIGRVGPNRGGEYHVIQSFPLGDG